LKKTGGKKIEGVGRRRLRVISTRIALQVLQPEKAVGGKGRDEQRGYGKGYHLVGMRGKGGLRKKKRTGKRVWTRLF